MGRKRIKLKCCVCGSEDIRRNCDAEWDIHRQRWEICAMFDTFSCEACGGECDIVEEEIEKEGLSDG